MAPQDAKMRKMPMISMFAVMATNDSPFNILFTIQGPVHHSRGIAVITERFAPETPVQSGSLSFRLSRA